MISRLRMTVLTAAAAVLVSPATGATAPVAQAHQSKVHKTSHQNSDRKLSILYDQTSNYGGFGMVSQNFGDQYDSAAIDDFMIPNGAKWTIKEVDVLGFYFNGYGPATSENIIFWQENLKGFGKAKVIAEYDNVVGSDNDGSFSIKLPGKGLKLKDGHYWMSVVVNMPFVPGGEWAWDNQTTNTVEGDPAMWENPGDGYGSGCTTWTVETECVPSPQGDHLFTLKGKAK